MGGAGGSFVLDSKHDGDGDIMESWWMLGGSV